MLMTVVGTVWSCTPVEGEESYTIKVSESLPGAYGKDGAPKGQSIRFSLDHTQSLVEGQPYRITARVTAILPVQEDDDIYVDGTVLEAELVELVGRKR